MNNNKSVKRFRLSSRALFLTYPKSNIVKDWKDILEVVFKELDVEWILVAEEVSDDEIPYDHYHALVKCTKKCDITNPNRLDVNGVHGHYQPVRSLLDTYRYITKGTVWEIMSERLSQTQIQLLITKMDQKLFTKKHLLKEKEFLQELLQSYSADKSSKLIRERVERIRSSSKLTRKDLEFLVSVHKNKKLIEDLDRMLRTEQATESVVFVHRNFLTMFYIWLLKQNKYNLPLSLYIRGDSGIGKTTVLEHLLGSQVLFIQHKDKLKSFEEVRHPYLVFDDVDLTGYTRDRLIQLVDSEQEFQADVKNSMINVPRSVTKFFTNNEHQHKLDDKAIARRLFKVNCRAKKPENAKEHSSDVLGAGVCVYVKGDSKYYDMVIDLEVPYVVFDKESVKQLSDQGHFYIPIKKGLIEELKSDERLLAKLLSEHFGDRHNNFTISMKVLTEQIRHGSSKISLQAMMSILNSENACAKCICTNLPEVALYGDMICLFCYYRRFTDKV